MENAKISWSQTSGKNKLGTILWALAGVSWLVLGIRWFSVAKEIGSLGWVNGAFLGSFVLYTVLTIGMFLSKNVCSSLVKVWGILLIVYDIVITVLLFVALNIVAKIIEDEFHFDLVSLIPIGEVFKLDGVAFVVILFLLAEIFSIVATFMIEVSDDKKSRLISLILCLFMWPVGGHLIYVGRTKGAVVRIILTVTVVLAIIPLIMTCVDFIKILIGKFKDRNGNEVSQWV